MGTNVLLNHNFTAMTKCPPEKADRLILTIRDTAWIRDATIIMIYVCTQWYNYYCDIHS